MEHDGAADNDRAIQFAEAVADATRGPGRAHACSWSPVDGEVGLYACACGASGRRNLGTGTIEALKARKTISRPTVGETSPLTTRELHASTRWGAEVNPRSGRR